MPRDGAAVRLRAQLVHDLGRRALHGLAADDGRDGDDGRAAGLQRLAHAGHGQDRIDAEPGVGRADDDARERRRGERLEHLRGGPRRGGALEADRAHRRPALLAHEIFLEGQRAPHRCRPPCARRSSDMGRMRAATPSCCRQMRADGGQRLARRKPPVRSTWVARSPSPSLNQVGPPSSPERAHEGPGLLAPAPAGLLVDHAGQRVEHRVDIGRDVQAQVLEVVAGVDDDGQALAQSRASPTTSLAPPTAAREHDVRAAALARSSEQVLGLGRTSAAAGRVSAVQSSPRTRAAGRPSRPRPWPARRRPPPHRQTRPRSPPAAGPQGPARRAGPTARVRPRRRWRARRCRAARPGRRCRR